MAASSNRVCNRRIQIWVFPASAMLCLKRRCTLLHNFATICAAGCSWALSSSGDILHYIQGTISEHNRTVFNRLYAVDANMRQEAVCVYKRRLSPPFHIERFLARTVSSVGMGHEAAGSNPAKSWPRSSSL